MSAYQPHAVRRQLRRIAAPAGLASFSVYSMTTPGHAKRHTVDVCLTTAEIRCNCENSHYRLQPAAERAGVLITAQTPEFLCKHAVRALAALNRTGELRPSFVLDAEPSEEIGLNSDPFAQWLELESDAAPSEEEIGQNDDPFADWSDAEPDLADQYHCYLTGQIQTLGGKLDRAKEALSDPDFASVSAQTEIALHIEDLEREIDALRAELETSGQGQQLEAAPIQTQPICLDYFTTPGARALAQKLAGTPLEEFPDI